MTQQTPTFYQPGPYGLRPSLNQMPPGVKTGYSSYPNTGEMYPPGMFPPPQQVNYFYINWRIFYFF